MTYSHTRSKWAGGEICSHPSRSLCKASPAPCAAWRGTPRVYLRCGGTLDQAEHRANDSHRERREQLEEPCIHPYASPICRDAAAAATGAACAQHGCSAGRRARPAAGWAGLQRSSPGPCSFPGGFMVSTARTNPSCLSAAQPIAPVMGTGVLLQSTRLTQPSSPCL